MFTTVLPTAAGYQKYCSLVPCLMLWTAGSTWKIRVLWLKQRERCVTFVISPPYKGKQLGKMCLKKTLKPLIFHAPWSPHMWKNCYYQHSLNLWPHTVQPTGSHSRQRTWLCVFFPLYSVWIIRPKMGTPDWVYGKSKKKKKQLSKLSLMCKLNIHWIEQKLKHRMATCEKNWAIWNNQR